MNRYKRDRYIKMKREFRMRHRFTTTQVIAFGFLSTILIGSLLLMLPFSSASNQPTEYVDALFTATTSVCVTGLVTVTTAEHWSFFGQVIIMLLIQFGGLGIMTVTTTILIFLRKRITLSERLLIQEAYNLETLRGLVKLTMKIIKGTIVIEGIGALFYSLVFIPEFGLLRGAWISIFNSVSAFCNAGMDVIGEYSLSPYRGNVIVNITTMSLIILGGIGYPVWWDVIGKYKRRPKKKSPRKFFSQLELHTKLAVAATFLLITIGAAIIFILEHRNQGTLAGLPLYEKIMASFFQSVTTRTAGYLTIPQENLTPGGAFISIILMFIGGSPSSTAGGIKTVTFAVIILTVITTLKGRNEVEVFHRKIADNYVKKALAVIGVSTFILTVSTIILTGIENQPFINILYETTSAIATVGLTRGITPGLSDIGKLVIISCMYMGRIGPISMALAFNINRNRGNIGSLPEEKVLIG